MFNKHTDISYKYVVLFIYLYFIYNYFVASLISNELNLMLRMNMCVSLVIMKVAPSLFRKSISLN